MTYHDIVPSGVAPSMIDWSAQTGRLPPARAMDSPKRDSEEPTPHPGMQAHARQDLASLDHSPDHHHHDDGRLQSQQLSSPFASGGLIKIGPGPSQEQTIGGETSSTELDLIKTAEIPDFHFGAAATAFTAGAQSSVVSLTSPISPPSLSIRTPTIGARRTIANRTAQKQAQAEKMLFSDLYKSPKSPLSKLRNSLPHPITVASSQDYDADLVSRDKSKNKEAVRRFLAEKIRNDWDFQWPLPTTAADGTKTAASDYSRTKGEKPNDVVEKQDPVTDAAAPSSNVPFSFNTVPTCTGNATNGPETEVEDRDSGEEADSESDAVSVYSIVSEDATYFRPRAEWTSDLSDSEVAQAATSPKNFSPFRFDSPDSVGAAVRSKVQAKRAKRRRALRDEVAWNDGLACFVARRDAWTGAKTVRVKPKTAVTSPLSPTSSKHLFWRTKSHTRTESTSSQTGHGTSPLAPSISAPAAGGHNGNPLSPTTTHASNTSSSEGDAVKPPSSPDYPIETLLPLAPPLIPPANSMRSSIVPSIYASIYDKVVKHSMQPSCPINLADMIRSCVAGWKRDGEWPPRITPPEPGVVAVRKKIDGDGGRKMSFGGLLGGGKARTSEESKEEDGAKGLRRSLQKVFG